MRVLLMPWCYYKGRILEVLPRLTECWRRNGLRQYPFIVKLFGFELLVRGGLCVMRAKQSGVSKHFPYAMHRCCDGTECEGVVGVEVLAVVVRVTYCVKMGKTVIEVYRHRDSWCSVEKERY